MIHGKHPMNRAGQKPAGIALYDCQLCALHLGHKFCPAFAFRCLLSPLFFSARLSMPTSGFVIAASHSTSLIIQIGYIVVCCFAIFRQARTNDRSATYSWVVDNKLWCLTGGIINLTLSSVWLYVYLSSNTGNQWSFWACLVLSIDSYCKVSVPRCG